MYPENLKYTETHEWIRIEENKITLGITYFAQKQLLDIVYVEFPKVGEKVRAKEPIIVVESCKSVTDIYSPVTGRVIEINEKLSNEPGLVNKDPYGEGWLIKIETVNSNTDSLLDSIGYQKLIKEGETH